MMQNVKKTNGGEFYTLDGREYKGLYIVDAKKNIAYIYRENTKKLDILVPKSIFNTETVRMRLNTYGGYASPQPFSPILTSFDYSVGKVNRYFVQKRTSPRTSIVEIDAKQFSMVRNSQSIKYINSRMYNKVMVPWLISGNERYVEHTNKKTIETLSKQFLGLDVYLKNYKQFYK